MKKLGCLFVEKGLRSYEAKVLETEASWLQKLAKEQSFTLVPSVTN